MRNKRTWRIATGYSRQVSVRIPTELYERLTRYSGEMGASLTDTVIRALDTTLPIYYGNTEGEEAQGDD